MRLTPHACPHPAGIIQTVLYLGISVAIIFALGTTNSHAYKVAAVALLPMVVMVVIEHIFNKVAMSNAEAKALDNFKDDEHKHIYSHLCSGRNNAVIIGSFAWAALGALLLNFIHKGETSAQVIGLLAASTLVIAVALWQWGRGKLAVFEKHPTNHLHP